MLNQWLAVAHVVTGVLVVLGAYSLIRETRTLRSGRGARMARPFMLLNVAVVTEAAAQVLWAYF